MKEFVKMHQFEEKCKKIPKNERIRSKNKRICKSNEIMKGKSKNRIIINRNYKTPKNIRKRMKGEMQGNTQKQTT